MPSSGPADGNGRWHNAKLRSRGREWSLAQCQALVPPTRMLVGIMPSSGPVDQDACWHNAKLWSRRPGCLLAQCQALVLPAGRVFDAWEARKANQVDQLGDMDNPPSRARAEIPSDAQPGVRLFEDEARDDEL